MSEPSAPDPDDGLAAALGQLVREREAAEVEARPPEWEALAAGELELDEVLARRRAAGEEDEGELDRAVDYFRSFDQGETSSLVDGLLAGLGSDAPASESQGAKVIPFKPSAAGEPESSAESSDAAPTSEAGRPAEPAHDPSKSSFWWIPGGMLAAAAAAIALWWVWPRDAGIGGEGGEPMIAQRDPLPSFALETDGGLRQLRGDDDGQDSAAKVHRYRRDTPFSWVLRPAVSTEGEVGLEAFALVDGGSAGLPLELQPQVADSGSIRIAGEIRDLGLEPGRYTIVLVVGWPDSLPNDASAVAEAGEGADWQVQRVEIEIQE